MDKNLLQKAKAPMIALIQTKNIMNNNLKTKTKRAAALLLMLALLAPLAAWAQNPDCNGPIAITADAPYTQGFEDGVLPGCWDVYAPPSYYTPDVYNYTYSHSGSYSLRFRNGLSYAVLPEFDVPLNQLQIRFQMRKEITNILFIDAQFNLGYITAEDDGTCNTFTAITTYNSSEYWGQQTTVLSTLPLTAQRLVIKASLSSVVCYIDDVEVAVFSGCYPVDSLNVSNVTDSSASLSWGLMDTEQTAWDVQVATDAEFTDIVAEYEADSHENYPISNLSSETHYYMRVKPICSDDLWSNTVDFTTYPPCDGPITITPDAPYTEGFESPEGTAYNVSGPLPDCWAGYKENNGIAPHNTTGNYNHSGSQSLSLYKSGWTELSVKVYAILPEFSNPLNQLQISFWMRAEGYDTYGELGLGYITAEDNGTCNTFTTIEGYYYNSSWVQHTKVLYTVPATAQRLVFLFSNLDVLHIDDLEVSVCECFPVSSLNVNDVTTNSAFLSWELVDESQTEWDVQVATDVNFTENLVEYVADTHENFLIDGLSVNTTYYVRVRAICDDTHQGEWSDAIFFSTLCEPITITADAPYTQDFESPVGTYETNPGPLPSCWEAYTTGTVAPHNTRSSGYNSAQSLSFYSSGHYAVLPEFSNPLNELQINFWMRSTSLILGYITAEDDGTCNTFTAIATYSSNLSWVQCTNYLLNVPDTARRLVFKSSDENVFCYIDDVEVSICTLDCFPVDVLSLDSLSSTSVYLSWGLIDDSQEAWDVQVATDEAFTDTVAEYVADSHVNYLLSGLSMGTTYYVRVKPTCSEDLWSNTIDFTTLCVPVTITADAPYFEDFESPEGVSYSQEIGPVPACWGHYTTSSVNPHIAGNLGVEGSQALMFYIRGDNYAILPEFSNPLNELQISFYMYSGGETDTLLQLGYITSEDDGTCNTFTTIESYDPSNYVMTQRTSCLPNVPDTAQLLVFKWSGSLICFIDNVTVSINPAILLHDVAAVNITPHEADITWEGRCDSYELRCWRVPTTEPETFLSEGFEDGTMPEGWTIEGDNQDPAKTWRVGVGDYQTNTGTHSGNYNALITHNFRNQVTYLVMPALNLGEYADAELSFWYVNRKWSSDIDHFAVCYRIGNEGEWNELWSTTENHEAWTSQTVELTGLANNCQIGFRFTDHFGYGVGLDDIALSGVAITEWINVSEAESPYTLTGLTPESEYKVQVQGTCEGIVFDWSDPVTFTTLEACSVPVITLGTVTATTAEFSWTGLSEGYTVMYRESIVRVVGEWQTLSVDEAAVTLNNLVPEADYEVKVIPSCDETKESAILTFTTANPCEAPTNLAVGNITTTTAEISWDGISLSGYEVEYYTATLIDTLFSEGFESGELPQGWTIEGDNQDPTKTWRVGAGDDQASTGTHSGDYNALITHNNRDEVTYLIMPAFDLGDYDNAQLSFWYVNRNWASDIDEIGVFYRIGTEGEWNELWSTADAHATWTHQTLALTGLADNYQIGFRMIDHWGRGIGLDDIVVFHELAPAGEPMTLTVVEGTTATLTGLADNTTYEARVKANCYEAEYSQPVGFTTPACPAPVATLGTVTATTAELSWTASLCEGYTVKYREKYTPIMGDTLVEEHFDSINAPEGWAFFPQFPYASQTNYAGGGENEWEINALTHSGYIQTPAIDLSGINQVQVSFRLYLSTRPTWTSGNNCYISIATSSDGGTTWHEGWNHTYIQRGFSFVSATISTSDMNQNNVLLRIIRSHELDYTAYFDDIVMVGMLPGEWQDLHVTDTTVTLTNLSPETAYQVKVVPDCNENKESELLTFSTANPCAMPTNLAVGNFTATTAEVSWDGLSLTGYEVEYYTVPLSEGFEGGTLPEGWTIEGDNQDPATTWRVGVGDYSSVTGPHSGDYNALITHNQDTDETFLVTPPLNLGAYESVELSFWYVNRRPDILVGFDYLSVYYRIGEEGEWNELWGTGLTEHNYWTYQTLTLTDLADNYQIGFMMYDHIGGTGVGLDDILIRTIPSTLTVEEGTTATLTGLAANTTYEVRVKSNCDAAEYCSPVVFTTAGMETFTKEIVGYGESNDGYYLIASPVVEPIMPSEENGFLTNAFDLYRFNQNGAQALEWENWKAEENYHFPIENGRGYLYASQENTTLTFVGTPYSGNGQVTLTKTDGVTFEGWNLVGNPFPTMAFIADGRPFYTVNGDGSQIIGVVSHSIEVMEAIFVIAEEDGETMTFTTEMPALGASLSLNVMATEPSDTPTYRAPTVVDRAIIRFDEGRQLPKFQLNGNSTKVYIPQGSMDYAVVCSEGKGEQPLNFKAAKNGTYTLTVNVENMELDYLHLIDNLTGADVDLLAVEPVETPTSGNGPSTSSGTLASYTFTAKTTDYESRFKLVFSADEDVCEPNEAFAYINNGNIVITTDMGDATLQIVDVMGRVVASYGGHTRCVSTSRMLTGVYVLRLVDGDSVRTQKIVIQ